MNSSQDTSASYDTAVIRKLLEAAFDDQELIIFCYDHFRDVCDLFAPKMGLRWKVQILIEYCERNLLFDDLLQLVNKKKPNQYRRFQQQLKPAKTATVSALPPGQTIQVAEAYVKIKFWADVGHLTNDQQQTVARAAVGAMAGVLNVPPDHIEIEDFWMGSTTLLVNMPEEAAKQMQSLYDSSARAIHDLGIEEVRQVDVFFKEGNDVVKALDIAHRVEGKAQVPNVIMELVKKADALRREGNLEKALGCCEDAYRLAVDQDWKDHANVAVDLEYAKGIVLAHLGTIYTTYGKEQLATALHWFAESGWAFQNCNKRYSHAVALMAQGKVHALEGTWLDAMKYYELSLQAFGRLDSNNHALIQLKQLILQHYLETQNKYHPPSRKAGALRLSEGHDISMEDHSDPFKDLWLRFVRLVDAVVILDPNSNLVLTNLKEKLILARNLIERESWRQDWQPLLDSLQRLDRYREPQNASRTMRELKLLVAKLIYRLLGVIPADKDLPSVRNRLKELAERFK